MVTIVRIPEPRYTPEEQARVNAGNFEDEFFSPAAAVDGYDKIIKDVTDRGFGTKAVVCVAQGGQKDDASPGGIMYQNLLLEKLDQLADLGVVVVTSSGNGGEDEEEIWDLPALYNGNVPIIVAGSVDGDGDILSISQYLPPANVPRCKVDLWAPGYNIKDWANAEHDPFLYNEGTSYRKFSVTCLKQLHGINF